MKKNDFMQRLSDELQKRNVADAADIARQKHQAAEQALRQALADLRALGCSAEELDALYAQMREELEP